MKIGTMFGDVMRSIFRRPATRNYPKEREDAPERLRGRLTFDAEKCVGCCLCSKECPANAIEIITIDKSAKRFIMRYHADRCIYCGQCVIGCRQGCIAMDDQQWELAARTRAPFDVYYGEEVDVEQFMARLAAGGAADGEEEGATEPDSDTGDGA